MEDTKQMHLYDQIKAILAEVEPDIAKFYNHGNNAAGTRVRKAMMKIRKLAQELRVEVQNIKHNL